MKRRLARRPHPTLNPNQDPILPPTLCQNLTLCQNPTRCQNLIQRRTPNLIPHPTLIRYQNLIQRRTLTLYLHPNLHLRLARCRQVPENP